MNDVLSVFMAVAAQLQKDFSDKKITVREFLELVQTVIEELGLGDKVILDFSKK
jgi:predicted kinase